MVNSRLWRSYLSNSSSFFADSCSSSTNTHTHTHTHTHTPIADQLFQYIANETNTKKSSSGYGLAPVSSSSHKSRTAPPTSTATNKKTMSTHNEATPPSSQQLDTKKDQ